MKGLLKSITVWLVGFVAIVLIFVWAVSLVIIKSSEKRIVNITDLSNDFDCVLILGAGVNPDKSPSDMLADRLRVGYAVYALGKVSKILVSGDNGKVEYNEVEAMKKYLIELGVAEEDIFMDHAGFSTYDSMYRARDIFRVRKLVVVTQKYHLYRAIYTADRLGLDAYGVSASLHKYVGQDQYDFREVGARVKAYFDGIFKPQPKFLGEPVPLE
jgi:vancomycin permeability regulator SanA